MEEWVQMEVLRRYPGADLQGLVLFVVSKIYITYSLITNLKILILLRNKNNKNMKER